MSCTWEGFLWSMALSVHWPFFSYGFTTLWSFSSWEERLHFHWRKEEINPMGKIKPRKTKIVCPTGPASESPHVIETLITAGMSVARLNFSHGTHEDHLRKIVAIRHIAERLKQPVAILQDLAGPKIRIGKMKNGGVELRRGDKFYLTNREIMGDKKGASVTYPSLPHEVKPGDRILL